MPLTSEQKKEYMREYMRKRRLVGSSGEKSSVMVENAERANEAMGEKKDVLPPSDQTMTICDVKFEGLKPGYYIFEKEVVKQKDGKDRKCWYCGCAYESRLLLNKFCCPDHKERWLQASLRRGE